MFTQLWCERTAPFIRCCKGCTSLRNVQECMALRHSSAYPLSPNPVYLFGVTVFFLSSWAVGQDGKFTMCYLQSLRAHYTVPCSTSLSFVTSMIVLVWLFMITQPSSLGMQKPLAKLLSPAVHSQHFLLTYAAVFFLLMFTPTCQSTTLEEYNI